jgi:hypothetical protein
VQQEEKCGTMVTPFAPYMRPVEAPPKPSHRKKHWSSDTRPAFYSVHQWGRRESGSDGDTHAQHRFLVRTRDFPGKPSPTIPRYPYKASCPHVSIPGYMPGRHLEWAITVHRAGALRRAAGVLDRIGMEGGSVSGRRKQADNRILR